MKKLSNKISVLVATVLVISSFCGCGKSGQDINIGQSAESTTSDVSAETQTITETENYTETKNPEITVADNWYNDGFVVPENWIEVMTAEKAFENFEELKDAEQNEKSLEEIVAALMNKNVIAFELLNGRGYEFDEQTDISAIHSEYFDSYDDITDLINGTYTSDFTDEYLSRKLFYQENDQLFAERNNLAKWVTAPFSDKTTYIEILNTDNSIDTCSFIWHYVSWERWDYENNDTDEWYPHHFQMTFQAVKENDEWRLTKMIFDNPELGMDVS